MSSQGAGTFYSPPEDDHRVSAMSIDVQQPERFYSVPQQYARKPLPKTPKTHSDPVSSYAAIPTHYEPSHSPSIPDKRPPPSGRFQRGLDRLGSWWTWEVVGVIVSLACLFAIVSIGVYLQDRPYDHWHSSISPNAMISTLTTISKAAILFAVAASVSQLKWLHFQGHPRRLADIDVFNEASTSPVGAIQFLFKMKAHALLASFAAVVIVAALLFEPMAQQLLSYQTESIVNENVNASLPVSNVFDMGGTWLINGEHSGTDGGFLLDDRIRVSILDGFFGSSNGSKPNSLQLPINCPSGNCTFDPFTTLGVCSSCQTAPTSEAPWMDTAVCAVNKLEDDPNNANETCTYTTKRGNSVVVTSKNLNPVGPAMVALNVSVANREESTNKIKVGINADSSTTPPDPTILSFFIVRTNTKILDGNITASFPPGWLLQTPPIEVKDYTECSLQWCAQSYDTVNTASSMSVSQAPSKTWPLKYVKPANPAPPLNTDTLLGEGYWSYASPKAGSTTARDNHAYAILMLDDAAAPPGNKTFTLNAADARGLQSFLATVLNVTQTAPAGLYNSFGLVPNPIDLSSPLLNAADLPGTLDNVAAGLSNTLRMLARPAVGASRDANPVSRSGTVMVSATIVKVSWGWIALPALVVLAGFAVLLLSIIAAERHRAADGARNVPLWKASNLGILSHGYDWREMLDSHDAKEREIVDVDSKEQVKDWARATQVRLVRDGEGHLRFRAVGAAE